MGNFLVKIIAWLVKITSSVAVGVVLFTLLLKLITLPFDFVSRASMRKNSVKMEKMRPELEKLQKQYAGNKDLYNKKMMALYKKNGYSMFGACLPTIITLVIFIVAINAFTKYSSYQNLKYFYDMSVSYNNVIYSAFDLGETENGDKVIYRDENGALIVDDEFFFNNGSGTVSLKKIGGEGNFDATVTVNADNYVLYTTNSYLSYQRFFTVTDGARVYGGKSFGVIEEKLNNNPLASEENNFLKINYDAKTGAGDDYATALANTAGTETPYTAAEFLKEIASEKSAETFRNNGSKFLWVKNIWVTDSPMKHPVESDWKTFVKTYSYDEKNSGGDMNEESYNQLIRKLEKEQTSANGYFILVLLTAGSSLLSQLIMNKTQKSQMELQTVDGQGAQQQKIMMWMMPIMMAIFAFMYTAAFSIYIVLSSFLSILTTLLINFIVDMKFKKAEERAEKEVVRSKVRVIKEQPKEEVKTKKKDEEEQVDFLSGLADKKGKKKR